MAAEIPGAPCDAKRARKELGEQLKRNRNADALVRGHVALYGLGSASLELMREAKRLADDNRAVFHQHQNFMAATLHSIASASVSRRSSIWRRQGLIGPQQRFHPHECADRFRGRCSGGQRHGAGLAPRKFHVLRHRAGSQKPLPGDAPPRQRRSLSGPMWRRPGHLASLASSPIW